MKLSSFTLPAYITALLFCMTIGILTSCSQKKEKQQEVTSTPIDTTAKTPIPAPNQEIKPQTGATSNPMADSLAGRTLTGKKIIIPPVTEPSRPKEPEVIIPSKPKVCDINLKLIATPKKGQQIYYVTGLVPGEFKCWVDMENASIKTCNGSPCLIYFVDIPNPKITSTGPHYLDAATLATHGVGRFDYNGKNWEMKGASMWGRKEKGYGYYNTDNAGGG